ncbi:MAG TPA: VWA domain-containing protein [Planctomycetaceae bacterium]|nr:VWA domain-containing protein [Planctomycetaceae bacterium]
MLPGSRQQRFLSTAKPAMVVESPRGAAERCREWVVRTAALIWMTVSQNPGWLLSGALHVVAAIALSLVLFHAHRDRNQGSLGIEAAPSDSIGDQNLESVLNSGAMDIVSSPEMTLSQGSALAHQASSEDAAARALGDIDRIGLGGTGQGAGTGGGGGPGLGAGFFGTQGKGQSFVYIVDMSGSMAGDRFRRAIEELMRSINKLRPEQSFFVYFFNDRTYPLFDPRPPRGLVPATPGNKTRALRWIRQRQPSSTTNPDLALQQALELKPDVIFLLTDGELDDPAEVRKMIRQKNKSKVTIHTIAFENEEGGATLEAIAGENNGTFRFIR